MSSRPQPIPTPLTPAAIFLVAAIDDGGEDALPGLSGLVRAVGFGNPAARLTLVTGIGSEAWDRLFDGPRPTRLHPFHEIAGARHRAPATPGGLLFHIRGESMDVCSELGGRVLASMAGAVTVVDEVHGFRFFEQRDLLGFVDGTEHPDGPEAVEAVRIGCGEAAFAGAGYVHVQKYTHDMTAWNALSVTEQELVIGRSKLEDIEMDDAVEPANSHLALNVIEDEGGNGLQIVGANMPFGTLGNTDRILDFSTALTGGARAVHHRAHRRRRRRTRPAGLQLGPGDGRRQAAGVRGGPGHLRAVSRRVDRGYRQVELVPEPRPVRRPARDARRHQPGAVGVAAGYPIREHLNRLVDGDVIWAPAIDGAFVLSTRGRDFDLQLGTDGSIGYLCHHAESVQLYLQETLTCLCYTAEASVALGS